jgi:glycosyltransferase involved in cell wall biosynthesis
MRLIVIQYAGDYLEAHRRLQESGTEIYYGHRYALEQLAHLGQMFGETAILCCRSGQKYNTKLPSGLTVIGAGVDPNGGSHVITQLISDYDPTHLVALAPMPRIIRWGITTNRRIFCLFADSFGTNGIRRFFRYGRLTRLLNHRRVEWVANHGINACVSLAKIGVERDKIIPWDWPHARQPRDTPPKMKLDSDVRTLVYVGAVNAQKGIGDVISAVAELKRRGAPVTLKVAGAGDLRRFEVLASRLGVEPEVHFLGLISNDSVLQVMRDASVIVVPSRHSSSEGLPLTIYEALCARTPIVASDHPMFDRRLKHRVNAMIYPAGKPAELAGCVEELFTNQKLYGSLSAAAQGAWEDLQISVKWGELLYRWAGDRAEDRRWLFESRLSSGKYALQLGVPMNL